VADDVYGLLAFPGENIMEPKKRIAEFFPQQLPVVSKKIK
jgi:hypothetical protein